MYRLTKIVAWLYDFLAEDMVLVIGLAVAIGITIIAVRVTSRGAGFLLWGLVLLAIAVSIIRTLTTSKS